MMSGLPFLHHKRSVAKILKTEKTFLQSSEKLIFYSKCSVLKIIPWFGDLLLYDPTSHRKAGVIK